MEYWSLRHDIIRSGKHNVLADKLKEYGQCPHVEGKAEPGGTLVRWFTVTDKSDGKSK